MRGLSAVSLIAVMATSVTLMAQGRQTFPGPMPTLPFSAAVKADGLVYVAGTIVAGGRHQGADQGGDREHEPGAAEGRLESRERGLGACLSHQGRRLRRDERGLSHVLAERPAGAHDHRLGPRAAGRPGRDVDGRRSQRRRARRHSSVRLDEVAQPLQLRHSIGRHALPGRPRLAQRQGQQRRRRRHGAPRPRRCSTTPGRSSRPRACRSTTSCRRACSSPIRRSSRR